MVPIRCASCGLIPSRVGGMILGVMIALPAAVISGMGFYGAMGNGGQHIVDRVRLAPRFCKRTRALAVVAVLLASGCRGDTKVPSGQEPEAATALTTTMPAPSGSRSPASSTAPPRDDTCKSDGECGLGMFGPDCCGECRYFEGSKAWIDRMDRFCRGAGFNPRCPAYDCPIQQMDPKCVEGHCRIVPATAASPGGRLATYAGSLPPNYGHTPPPVPDGGCTDCVYHSVFFTTEIGSDEALLCIREPTTPIKPANARGTWLRSQVTPCDPRCCPGPAPCDVLPPNKRREAGGLDQRKPGMAR